MSWLKIAVGGHVDHGKSSLVGCLKRHLQRGLYASDLDKALISDTLKEERQFEKTMALGRSTARLGPDSLTILDAPGHREYLSGFITAVSAADILILVVDAREGFKEQTYLHLRLCALLNQCPVLIFISKMDAINWNARRFYELKSEAEEYALQMGLTISDIVSGTSLSEEGLLHRSRRDSFGQLPSLLECLMAYQPNQEPRTDWPLRILIQGNMTKAYGTLLSGKPRVHQKIQVFPKGYEDEIVEITPESLSEIWPIPIGIRLAKHSLKRGDRVCSLASDILVGDSFHASGITFLEPKGPTQMLQQTKSIPILGLPDMVPLIHRQFRIRLQSQACVEKNLRLDFLNRAYLFDGSRVMGALRLLP